MTTTKREKSLIVIQLSGGNDYLNTVIPYSEGKYYDYRSTVNIPQNKVIPIDDHYGFNPSMGPVKSLWDEGKVAIINGIGYQNPNRSHFRSMDIWHTAEPDSIGKGHPRHRPPGRERAHRHQLRPGSAQGVGLPGRFRRVGW